MWFLNHLGNSAMSSVFIMAIVLTIFPSLISTRDNSVLQKVQATNVIEANNTVSSSSSMINGIVTKIVKVNDIEVAYKIFGRGEPLFLVPGFSMTMDMWDPIVLHMLSSNHTIIIFDNRGIGSTTAGIKTPSIQQFANDTAALIDVLEIKKPVDIFGLSMGGFIAQELTLLHPK